MEDDDEIQSHHASPESPPSGRIAVTVAAAAPSSTPSATETTTSPPANQNSLALALPIQRPAGGSGGGGGGGGREDCWSEGATSVLIDAWGERYMELSRGNLKQKHWQEVADIVSSRDDYTKPPKTDIQCKNRIDTVKKKYKSEKSKVSAGSGPSRWPFYDRLDRLIGPTAAASAVKVAPSSASKAATASAVPVGIPVGVRSLPFPMSHYSPFMQHQHNQQPQQQQQQQHIRQSNFASPVYHKFNSNSNSNINASNLNLSNNSKPQNHLQHHNQQQFRRGPPIPPPDLDSEPEEGWSPDSGDSLPPETPFERRKRPRVETNNNNLGGVGMGREKREKGEMVKWGNSVRELTKAILKFGEAYESAESAKLQQIVEMEKQRMKFAKELELQRIKFLMKTQLELSQLNVNGNSDNRGGGSSGRRGGGRGSGGGGGGGVDSNHDNHHNHANSDSSN